MNGRTYRNKKLISIRKGLGLTQEEFAKGIKVKPLTITKLETGSMPNCITLKKIKTFFGKNNIAVCPLDLF